MSTYPKRSPLEAIRVFCVECQGGSFQGVEGCRDLSCPFRIYRRGTTPEGKPHRPTGAIKIYCSGNCLPGSARADIGSCGGDRSPQGPCPVFPFRMGVNPNISHAAREKRRQAAIERGPVGIIAMQESRIDRPFDAPESTERAEAGLWSHYATNIAKPMSCYT